MKANNINKTIIKGHIRPRPNKKNVKYYDVILELGKDPITGKRKQIPFHVDGSYEDAQAVLIQKQAEYLNSELLIPSKMTVKTLVEQFKEMYVDLQGASSKRYYKGIFNRYILPYFGDVELQKLNSMQIQKLYNELLKCSPYTKKPLSPNTIDNLNNGFRCMLNYAVRMEYIKKNPIDNVVLPKIKTCKDIEVYTKEELCDLLEKIKGTDMELCVYLLLEGALRRGELAGLRYEYVDIENRIIKVRESLVEDENEKAVVSDCKSDSSRRDFVISDYTASLLKKQLQKYKENKLKLGKKFEDTGYVICQENGKPYQPKSIYRKWKRLLEAKNLRHIPLHGTRHSVVTLLMDYGVPVHVVQNLAGHASATLTLDTYTHMTKKSNGMASSVLQKEIFDKVNINEENTDTPILKLVK